MPRQLWVQENGLVDEGRLLLLLTDPIDPNKGW